MFVLDFKPLRNLNRQRTNFCLSFIFTSKYVGSIHSVPAEKSHSNSSIYIKRTNWSTDND